MRKVYFVFNDMKEAEYYWRELTYFLKMFDSYTESFRGPYRITTYIKKDKKVGFLKNILIKLKLAKKEYVEVQTEIVFKSKKSNLKGINEKIYNFFEDFYEDSYFLKLLKEI